MHTAIWWPGEIGRIVDTVRIMIIYSPIGAVIHAPTHTRDPEMHKRAREAIIVIIMTLLSRAPEGWPSVLEAMKMSMGKVTMRRRKRRGGSNGATARRHFWGWVAW
jgi:hypothetical protein